jgi:hypothetical protein
MPSPIDGAGVRQRLTHTIFLAAKASTPEVSPKPAEKHGFSTWKTKGARGATQPVQNSVFTVSFYHDTSILNPTMKYPG